MKISLKSLSDIFKRDLIKKNEGKLTYVQFFGFILITLGLIYLASFLLPSGVIDYLPSLKLEDGPTPEGISISFFTIMLGIAFAFPAMLKGHTKDISTMRIIVFMLANVICMLLLKMGWDKDSLADIGMDGYWMGLIAFLFGAKTAQSFFENRRSFSPNSKEVSNNENSYEISKIAIAQIAKVQNEEKLHEMFSNIEFVSDTVKNEESCLAIYLKDNNTIGFPTYVLAQINEHCAIKVPVEIVPEMGTGKVHYTQLTNDIANSNTSHYKGSICCQVESVVNPNFRGLVTSGHIFTRGEFVDFEGFVTEDLCFTTLSNQSIIGSLHFQQMTPNQDLAIVELNNPGNLPNQMLSFPGGFYGVTTTDLNSTKPNITILSKNNRKREAFLVDINISLRVFYQNSNKIMRNIILIGSDRDKLKSKTVSGGGDSGSCVYHTATGKLIGMLMGGNDKFSFVLPFEQTLLNNNFKIR